MLHAMNEVAAHSMSRRGKLQSAHNGSNDLENTSPTSASTESAPSDKGLALDNYPKGTSNPDKKERDETQGIILIISKPLSDSDDILIRLFPDPEIDMEELSYPDGIVGPGSGCNKRVHWAPDTFEINNGVNSAKDSAEICDSTHLQQSQKSYPISRSMDNNKFMSPIETNCDGKKSDDRNRVYTRKRSHRRSAEPEQERKAREKKFFLQHSCSKGIIESKDDVHSARPRARKRTFGSPKSNDRVRKCFDKKEYSSESRNKSYTKRQENHPRFDDDMGASNELEGHGHGIDFAIEEWHTNRTRGTASIKPEALEFLRKSSSSGADPEMERKSLQRDAVASTSLSDSAENIGHGPLLDKYGDSELPNGREALQVKATKQSFAGSRTARRMNPDIMSDNAVIDPYKHTFKLRAARDIEIGMLPSSVSSGTKAKPSDGCQMHENQLLEWQPNSTKAHQSSTAYISENQCTEDTDAEQQLVNHPAEPNFVHEWQYSAANDSAIPQQGLESDMAQGHHHAIRQSWKTTAEVECIESDLVITEEKDTLDVRRCARFVKKRAKNQNDSRKKADFRKILLACLLFSLCIIFLIFLIPKFFRRKALNRASSQPPPASAVSKSLNSKLSKFFF